MIKDLLPQLIEFKQTEIKLLGLKDELKKKENEFNIQNYNLMEEINKLTFKMEDTRNDAKLEAIKEYELTGQKKLFGGIGIRIGTSLVYDEKMAFEWAKQHQLCLSLDERAFEEIAKSQNLEFVRKEEKITATFPSKLNLEESKGFSEEIDKAQKEAEKLVLESMKGGESNGEN
jgi:hypothetical protein